MIFAREISDNLTSLVKKIDAETAKNKSAKMGSFVVFLTADEKISDKLKELGEKEGIKNTILSSMETPAGPEKYRIVHLEFLDKWLHSRGGIVHRNADNDETPRLVFVIQIQNSSKREVIRMWLLPLTYFL